MSNVGPDGLAKFRRNLHTLLHSNDNKPYVPRKDADHVKIQMPRAKRQPNENILTQARRHSAQDLKSEREKWEQEKSELQNAIEVKNNKILTLSKANLERAETIKTLNEKVERLEKLNSQKDIQIDQLEKLILRLQSLSRANENSKMNRSSTVNRYENDDMHNSDKRIEDDDYNDYYDNDEISELSPSVDKSNLHEATISLLNSKNTVDLDSEINLNTQQLMDLDLRHLTFSKSNEPAIYNSNTTKNLHYSGNDSDSDLEKYLFSV